MLSAVVRSLPSDSGSPGLRPCLQRATLLISQQLAGGYACFRRMPGQCRQSRAEPFRSRRPASSRSTPRKSHGEKQGRWEAQLGSAEAEACWRGTGKAGPASSRAAAPPGERRVQAAALPRPQPVEGPGGGRGLLKGTRLRPALPGTPIGGGHARARALYQRAAGFIEARRRRRRLLPVGARGMAVLPLLPVLLVLPVLPLPVPPPPPPPVPPPLPSGNASLSGCPPGLFQCKPGDPCFRLEWLCDGHPDCEDERDEQDCGTDAPAEPSPDGFWVTPPRSSAVLPTGSAEASATPVPGGSVPSRSQGRTWILIIAGKLLVSSCWLMVLSSTVQY
ncbi:CD320 antigen isoform X2 [Aquila chrysaetos chrysaetos]|uniref:CD320 antigen isoform X2 n=1 Tax=Aquila chrysaetos chrysaetos TaxID=223781 RepID=UPI001B7D35D4|nr:CD320 antigen isoform X2 [Aquila chrysaetos chrysaetos]